MGDALLWFLTIQLLGALALPWVFHIFKFLPDRGMTLVKPVGLLGVAYLVWLLGTIHLLPNVQPIVWLIVILLAAASGWLAWRSRRELADLAQTHWPVIAASEAVFLVMFVGWAMIASGSPSITHTEKPMDLMLLNAAYQARYFPAEDAWLAGHSISYYYFGHIIMATVSKLSGVATSVGYNLAVATLPALAGSACFGILYNLVRLSRGSQRWALGIGVAAPMCILLTGNLAGGLEFLRAQGWGGAGFWNWVGIEGLRGEPKGSGLFSEDFWWWFRDTRIIGTSSGDGVLDYTITEFPFFSFVLGDLHAHVLAIPFFLLAIATALNVYCSKGDLDLAWFRRNPAVAAIAALAGGALAFINFWDFPTFMAILAASLFLKGYRDHPESLMRAANGAATVFLPILVASLVLFAPIYATYSSQTSGVLPLREVSTRPFHLFLVLGLFILPSLAFLARLLPSLRLRGPMEPQAAALAFLIASIPLVLWVATGFPLGIVDHGAGAALDDLGRRLLLAAPGAIVVGVGVYLACAISRGKADTALSFVLLLMAAGFFLVMIAELFHIVDSFSGPWRRMNTVFKVYYQAWLLLGIAAVFAVYVLGSGGGRRFGEGARARVATALWGRFARIGLAVLLLSALYYSLGAALDRGGAFGAPLEGRTLDGLAHLQVSDPGEYTAIAWLRDEAPYGRVVEAVGEDYTRYSSISASTGLPTVLGWSGHELQWRGSSEPFAGRAKDVETIYTSQDPAEVERLLVHYDVRYVYLGSREFASYGVSSLSQNLDFLEAVFQDGGVLVYEFRGYNGN